MFQLNPLNTHGMPDVEERVLALLDSYNIEGSDELKGKWSKQFASDILTLYTFDAVSYMTEEQLWSMYRQWVCILPEDFNDGPLRRKALIDFHLGNNEEHVKSEGNVVQFKRR